MRKIQSKIGSYFCLLSLFLLAWQIDRAESSETREMRFRDISNREVSNLHFNFGVVIDEQPSFESESAILRLESVLDKGYIEPLVAGCRIGSIPLSGKAVSMTLNGKNRITVVEAKTNFFLKLKIENPKRLSGTLHCQELSLFYVK